MLFRYCLLNCFLLIAFNLNIGLVYANEDYSDGFKAYLEGDFVEAQSKWLQSAKLGDARSMFNLGLLHEQSKVKNADEAKAYEWFRLAGSSGYSPANYHLALKLFSLNKNDQANSLMNKAASNDFQPAIKYLNKTSKSYKAKLPNKPVVKLGTSVSDQGYLFEEWIKSKKSNYWTIQMLAFSDKDKVQRFIDEHNLKNKAAYFKEKVANETFYKLIYGVYKTKIQADFARQNLTEELAKHGPWLRTIESVQSVIKAQ